MHLFSYNGRMGRLKFFIATTVSSVVVSILSILAFFVYATVLIENIGLLPHLSPGSAPSFVAFLAPMAIPLFLVMLELWFVSTLVVKRFHDLNKRGAWWWAMLIPGYNIHLAFGLLMERGTVGQNQYGDDPLPPGANPNDIVHRLSHDKRLRMFLVILTFVILAVSGFSGSSRQTSQPFRTVNSFTASTTPTAASQPNGAYAGWQTYTDMAGGFSILYPAQYKLGTKSSFANAGEADIYSTSSPSAPLISISYSPGTQTPQSIYALVVSEAATAQKEFPSVTYSTSTAMIAGTFPAQVIFTSGPSSDGAIYIFGVNGESFKIGANYEAGSAGNIASSKTLADSIIATFKTTVPSTGQTNDNNWQSYTDAQFGVTFPYPPGYWVQTSLNGGNSEDISVRPTNETQLSGVELIKISMNPESTDSPQSESARWLNNLRYGGYTISTSTTFVAGYPAQYISIAKPYDNGALYIFGTGTYTVLINVYYDNASSLPNSPSTEAINRTAATRIINGFGIH